MDTWRKICRIENGSKKWKYLHEVQEYYGGKKTRKKKVKKH
jgi:hypothetical protein